MKFISMIYRHFLNTKHVLYGLFVLCVLFANPLHGQNNIKHLTQRDGLNTGFIYEMMEDDKGYIWLATNIGMSKYDGLSFTNFTVDEKDSTSLNGARVYKVVQYDEKTLLVASIAGLEIMDLESQTFSLVKIPDDLEQPTNAYDIQITSDKGIYVYTDVGIFYFESLPTNKATIKPEFYPVPDKIANPTAVRNVFELVDDNTLWASFGTELAKLNKATKEFQLIQNVDQETKDIINSTIWDMYKTKNGDLLISAIGGLLILEKNSDQLKPIKNLGTLTEEQIKTASFQSVYETPDERLFFGTSNQGMIIWDPKTNTIQNIKNSPDNVNSIKSNDVHYAMLDKQNNIWYGYHEDGISVQFPNNFNYTYHRIENTQTTVDSIYFLSNFYEDSDNSMWFSTPNALVKKSTDGRIEPFILDENQSDTKRLSAILPIDDNNLLIIGDSIKTYFKLNKNDKRFTKLSSDTSRIRGFEFQGAETNDGYYLGSENGYLVRIDKNDYTLSTIDFPFPENYSFPIKPVIAFKKNEKELTVFVITISSFGPPNFKVYNYNTDTDESTQIVPNTKDFPGFGLPEPSKLENGVYWITVMNGILKLNINTGETDLLFENEAGLLSMGNRNATITEDKNGYLWYNITNSILRLDPITETISYHDLQDDQRPRTVLKGVLKDDGNVLYFGDGGYIEFNTEELQKEGKLKDIHITSLESGDSSINALYQSDVIEFEDHDANLSFSFLGINYKDPASTKYRYRIKGYDDDWNYIGTQNRVYLANIPSGSYTFEVQAASRFGGYSDKSATIDFKIPPPWWRTWPAYLLYAFILIGSLFLFDRVQRQRVIAKERERTREIELKQAKEIEIAYENLKATQNKLIQSEKMASLGELTAGIAHEIQNPLNFVNNFAEVSSELIDETKEELHKGELSEVNSLLDDIKENLNKINHHGKRADGIVKGMLQHSRDNSGTKELTDINQLADEYLRLAYHGFRAKDKSFNAKLETDFQKSLNKVSVVPQDIGRVILNIITNAFHAVTEKKALLNGSVGTNYNPTVLVKTYDVDNQVILKVKDNGNGIPENVKNKIFQPFFTTKPAGHGTGLGLSLSYDIVKAHNGDIEVKSEEGTGTTFTVSLPKQSLN